MFRVQSFAGGQWHDSGTFRSRYGALALAKFLRRECVKIRVVGPRNGKHTLSSFRAMCK